MTSAPLLSSNCTELASPQDEATCKGLSCSNDLENKIVVGYLLSFMLLYYLTRYIIYYILVDRPLYIDMFWNVSYYFIPYNFIVIWVSKCVQRLELVIAGCSAIQMLFIINLGFCCFPRTEIINGDYCIRLRSCHSDKSDVNLGMHFHGDYCLLVNACFLVRNTSIILSKWQFLLNNWRFSSSAKRLTFR